MVQMSCNMFKIKAVRNKEGHLSIQPKKNVHLKTALEVLKYTECCEQGLNVHLVRARNSSFTNKMVNASCKAGQGFSAFYFIHRYNYLVILLGTNISNISFLLQPHQRMGGKALR